MFDLTPEIKLEPKCQKIYHWLQALAGAAFIFGFLYLGYLAFFPAKSFFFSFTNPSSSKNTILINKEAQKENGLVLDAILPASEGFFSEVRIDVQFDKVPPAFQEEKISIAKSYQSFFYPSGEPAGFKDGDLVKNKENYYLVSQRKLRKFSNAQVLKNLGFSPDNFEKVDEEELKYNPLGENISNTQSYPDGSLAKVGEDYYQLKNNQLAEFISFNAYLSQYFEYQAVERDADFLNKHELVEDKLGFASGALVSYGQSVFIVSGNEVLPINSPADFESMGFNWDDVIAASSEEIGIYEKGKLFTANRSHPDGTVFVDRESGKYYLVQGGTKKEITGPHIIKSYLKKSPVLVDEEGLLKKNSCQLKEKSSLFGKSYGCLVAIENLGRIPGNNYRFEVVFFPDIKTKEMQIAFQRAINWNNLRSSLAEIKQKIISRYYGQPQQ